MIGYLDNISSSEPTGYDTYTGTSVSPYIRHAERLRAEGTIGMRNSTVARGRRAVAATARHAPHVIGTARVRTTRSVPEATLCANASAHAGRKAAA